METLIKLQEADKDIQGLIRGPGTKHQFCKKEGVICRVWRPRNSTKEIKQLVLPAPCRSAVLKLAHSIPWAGHMGRDKTARRILQRFYWPTLFRDVAEYCRTCPECQRASGKKQQLVPLPIMGEPFQRIAVDIVGPLPKSRRGNRFILVICDYATRGSRNAECRC